MRRSLPQAIAIALLGLIAVAASTGVAKAASALEHACCPGEARSAAADDAPCHGFLPLSCCDAAALPTYANEPAPPAPLALPASALVAAIGIDRAPLPAHVARTPRASPLLRSTVLQL